MLFDTIQIKIMEEEIVAEVNAAVALEFEKLPTSVQSDPAIIATFAALSQKVAALALSQTMNALQEQARSLTSELTH